MMLTGPLSDRTDLIESLDSELVFDYLLQHGVLDEDIVSGISIHEDPIHRNKALVQYIDEYGNHAVALFINALRVSGQLHIASSLDVTQRIKPVVGKGYLEKQRYKGQVLIKISVSAVKVLAPEHEPDDKPEVEPLRRKRSILEFIGSNCPTSSTQDDEDGDEVKSNAFCMCFCLPLFRKRHKKKEEIPMTVINVTEKKRQMSHSKYEKVKVSEPSVTAEQRCEFQSITPTVRSETKEGLSSDQSDHIIDNTRTDVIHDKPHHPTNNNSLPRKADEEIKPQRGKRSKSSKKNTKPAKVPVKDKRKKAASNKQQTFSDVNDDNATRDDGETDSFLEQAAPDSHKHSNTSRYTVLIEKWKERGPLFNEKAKLFSSFIDASLQNGIIRYFEQDRSTLILQINTDDDVTLCNICMTKPQIHALKADHSSGKLNTTMEKLLVSKELLANLEVLGLRLSTKIDKDDFDLALQDL